MTRALLLFAAVALAAAAVACGSTTTTSTTAATTTTGAAGTTGAATAATAGPAVPTGKPQIVIPSTPPPTSLEVEDITVGTGAAAALGQSITVQYVGVSYSTKKQFDASWDRGQPATFPLVEGGLIAGWVKGIPGMKVGGRRKLTIPPSLGYGASGSPPDIGPNETLVFVIDLLDAK